MKPDVTVRDPKTGEVIFEGFLHHYSLNMGRGGYTFEITGAIAPSTSKPTASISHVDLEEPLDIVEDVYPTVASKGCNHEWDNYVGLVESFEFCKLCSEKKNVIQDGWSKR